MSKISYRTPAGQLVRIDWRDDGQAEVTTWSTDHKHARLMSHEQAEDLIAANRLRCTTYDKGSEELADEAEVGYYTPPDPKRAEIRAERLARGPW